MKKFLIGLLMFLFSSSVTAKDSIDCLINTVYFEARSESHLGQIAIVHVVLNRMESSLFPDTVCNVVHQPFAFSYLNDKEKLPPKNDKKALQTVKMNIHEAIEMFPKYDVTKGALYYHAKYVNPDWAEWKDFVVKIGNHLFYRNYPVRMNFPILQLTKEKEKDLRKEE